jgi:uncharacterized protein (TIGR03067 family)
MTILRLSIRSLLLVALAALAPATDGTKEAIIKERKRFAGSWKVVSLEVNGTKALDKDTTKLTVINGSDGTWSLLSEGKEVSKGISTIDPTASPKTIDFTPTAGEAKDKEYVGIYELSADSRKLCFAPRERGRPTEFASSSGSDQIVVLFAREKAR